MSTWQGGDDIEWMAEVQEVIDEFGKIDWDSVLIEGRDEVIQQHYERTKWFYTKLTKQRMAYQLFPAAKKKHHADIMERLVDFEIQFRQYGLFQRSIQTDPSGGFKGVSTTLVNIKHMTDKQCEDKNMTIEDIQKVYPELLICEDALCSQINPMELEPMRDKAFSALVKNRIILSRQLIMMLEKADDVPFDVRLEYDLDNFKCAARTFTDMNGGIPRQYVLGLMDQVKNNRENMDRKEADHAIAAVTMVFYRMAEIEAYTSIFDELQSCFEELCEVPLHKRDIVEDTLEGVLNAYRKQLIHVLKQHEDVTIDEDALRNDVYYKEFAKYEYYITASRIFRMMNDARDRCKCGLPHTFWRDLKTIEVSPNVITCTSYEDFVYACKETVQQYEKGGAE